MAWVRRKMGPDVVVWRERRDGSLGVAVPCVLCRKQLERFRMRVHAVQDPGGGWWHGEMTDANAPPSKLTSGQARAMHPRRGQRASI